MNSSGPAESSHQISEELRLVWKPVVSLFEWLGEPEKSTAIHPKVSFLGCLAWTILFALFAAEGLRESTVPIANAELDEKMGLRGLRQFLPLALSALHVATDAASAIFKSRATIQLENLTLPNQLGVLQRSVNRPKLMAADRLLWAWLTEHWGDWRVALVIVKPATAVA